MLNTNEVRARAAEFAREWADASYERGQAQTFYIEFFQIFGVKSRRVASFEEPVKKLGDKRGFIDLFWKGTLIAEHKSAGKDLTKAKQQALDYFPGLKEAELPRYVLVCDFQNFELYDLDERSELKFKLQDLPKYVQPKACETQIAFVATNSITQGEQVAQLWPLLFSRYGLEISFAHRTFAWGSDARGKAHVHVVILGLVKRAMEWADKRLFSYDDINGDPSETRHKVLSPYLFDAANLHDRHLVVEEENASLAGMPKVIIGSKPIDGGYYLFDGAEAQAFLAEEPGAAKFLRPFVGAEDFVNNEHRFILALQEAPPNELRSLPKVMSRIDSVKRYRLGEIPARRAAEAGETKAKKRGEGTVELAQYPTRFHVTVIPKVPYLVFPRHTSERREYAPFGWLSPPAIPGDSSLVLLDADLWIFGIITSRMHMAWLRNIGGRLKSDYRYSVGIVYNAYPWPDANENQREKIRALAQDVLNARAKFPKASLADLYDPDAMPPDLRKAHRKLDDAVDALYKKGGFASDRERVEHLFMLYEKLVSPLTASTGKKKRARTTN